MGIASVGLLCKFFILTSILIPTWAENLSRDGIDINRSSRHVNTALLESRMTGNEPGVHPETRNALDPTIGDTSKEERNRPRDLILGNIQNTADKLKIKKLEILCDFCSKCPQRMDLPMCSPCLEFLQDHLQSRNFEGRTKESPETQEETPLVSIPSPQSPFEKVSGTNNNIPINQKAHNKILTNFLKNHSLRNKLRTSMLNKKHDLISKELEDLSNEHILNIRGKKPIIHTFSSHSTLVGEKQHETKDKNKCNNEKQENNLKDKPTLDVLKTNSFQTDDFVSNKNNINNISQQNNENKPHVTSSKTADMKPTLKNKNNVESNDNILSNLNDKISSIDNSFEMNEDKDDNKTIEDIQESEELESKHKEETQENSLVGAVKHNKKNKITPKYSEYEENKPHKCFKDSYSQDIQRTNPEPYAILHNVRIPLKKLCPIIQNQLINSDEYFDQSNRIYQANSLEQPTFDIRNSEESNSLGPNYYSKGNTEDTNRKVSFPDSTLMKINLDDRNSKILNEFLRSTTENIMSDTSKSDIDYSGGFYNSKIHSNSFFDNQLGSTKQISKHPPISKYFDTPNPTRDSFETTTQNQNQILQAQNPVHESEKPMSLDKLISHTKKEQIENQMDLKSILNNIKNSNPKIQKDKLKILLQNLLQEDSNPISLDKSGVNSDEDINYNTDENISSPIRKFLVSGQNHIKTSEISRKMSTSSNSNEASGRNSKMPKNLDPKIKSSKKIHHKTPEDTINDNKLLNPKDTRKGDSKHSKVSIVSSNVPINNLHNQEETEYAVVQVPMSSLESLVSKTDLNDFKILGKSKISTGFESIEPENNNLGAKLNHNLDLKTKLTNIDQQLDVSNLISNIKSHDNSIERKLLVNQLLADRNLKEKFKNFMTLNLNEKMELLKNYKNSSNINMKFNEISNKQSNINNNKDKILTSNNNTDIYVKESELHSLNIPQRNMKSKDQRTTSSLINLQENIMNINNKNLLNIQKENKLGKSLNVPYNNHGNLNEEIKTDDLKDSQIKNSIMNNSKRNNDKETTVSSETTEIKDQFYEEGKSNDNREIKFVTDKFGHVVSATKKTNILDGQKVFESNENENIGDNKKRNIKDMLQKMMSNKHIKSKREANPEIKGEYFPQNRGIENGYFPMINGVKVNYVTDQNTPTVLQTNCDKNKIIHFKNNLENENGYILSKTNPENNQKFSSNYQQPREHYQRPPKYYQLTPEYYKQSPENYQQSPEHYKQSPEHYQQFPENYQPSPEHYQQSPEHYKQSPEHYQKSPEHYQRSLEHYQRSPEHYQQSPNYYQQYPKNYQQSPEHFQEFPAINQQASKVSSAVNNIDQNHIPNSEARQYFENQDFSKELELLQENTKNFADLPQNSRAAQKQIITFNNKGNEVNQKESEIEQTTQNISELLMKLKQKRLDSLHNMDTTKMNSEIQNLKEITPPENMNEDRKSSLTTNHKLQTQQFYPENQILSGLDRPRNYQDHILPSNRNLYHSRYTAENNKNQIRNEIPTYILDNITPNILKDFDHRKNSQNMHSKNNNYRTLETRAININRLMDYEKVGNTNGVPSESKKPLIEAVKKDIPIQPKNLIESNIENPSKIIDELQNQSKDLRENLYVTENPNSREIIEPKLRLETPKIFKDIGQELKKFATDESKAISDHVVQGWNEIKSIPKTFTNKVLPEVGDNLKQLRSNVARSSKTTGSLFNRIIPGVKSGITDLVDKQKDLITDKYLEAKNAITDIAAEGKDTVINTLLDKINPEKPSNIGKNFAGLKTLPGLKIAPLKERQALNNGKVGAASLIERLRNRSKGISKLVENAQTRTAIEHDDIANLLETSNIDLKSRQSENVHQTMLDQTEKLEKIMKNEDLVHNIINTLNKPVEETEKSNQGKLDDIIGSPNKREKVSRFIEDNLNASQKIKNLLKTHEQNEDGYLTTTPRIDGATKLSDALEKLNIKKQRALDNIADNHGYIKTTTQKTEMDQTTNLLNVFKNPNLEEKLAERITLNENPDKHGYIQSSRKVEMDQTRHLVNENKKLQEPNRQRHTMENNENEFNMLGNIKSENFELDKHETPISSNIEHLSSTSKSGLDSTTKLLNVLEHLQTKSSEISGQSDSVITNLLPKNFETKIENKQSETLSNLLGNSQKSEAEIYTENYIKELLEETEKIEKKNENILALKKDNVEGAIKTVWGDNRNLLQTNQESKTGLLKNSQKAATDLHEEQLPQVNLKLKEISKPIITKNHLEEISKKLLQSPLKTEPKMVPDLLGNSPKSVAELYTEENIKEILAENERMKTEEKARLTNISEQENQEIKSVKNNKISQKLRSKTKPEKFEKLKQRLSEILREAKNGLVGKSSDEKITNLRDEILQAINEPFLRYEMCHMYNEEDHIENESIITEPQHDITNGPENKERQPENDIISTTRNEKSPVDNSGDILNNMKDEIKENMKNIPEIIDVVKENIEPLISELTSVNELPKQNAFTPTNDDVNNQKLGVPNTEIKLSTNGDSELFPEKIEIPSESEMSPQTKGEGMDKALGTPNDQFISKNNDESLLVNDNPIPPKSEPLQQEYEKELEKTVGAPDEQFPSQANEDNQHVPNNIQIQSKSEIIPDTDEKQPEQSLDGIKNELTSPDEEESQLPSKKIKVTSIDKILPETEDKLDKALGSAKKEFILPINENENIPNEKSILKQDELEGLSFVTNSPKNIDMDETKEDSIITQPNLDELDEEKGNEKQNNKKQDIKDRNENLNNNNTDLKPTKERNNDGTDNYQNKKQPNTQSIDETNSMNYDRSSNDPESNDATLTAVNDDSIRDADVTPTEKNLEEKNIGFPKVEEEELISNDPIKEKTLVDLTPYANATLGSLQENPLPYDKILVSYKKLKDMYIVGDGFKLPLTVQEGNDGDLEMNIDFNKFCDETCKKHNLINHDPNTCSCHCHKQNGDSIVGMEQKVQGTEEELKKLTNELLRKSEINLQESKVDMKKLQDTFNDLYEYLRDLPTDELKALLHKRKVPTNDVINTESAERRGRHIENRNNERYDNNGLENYDLNAGENQLSGPINLMVSYMIDEVLHQNVNEKPSNDDDNKFKMELFGKLVDFIEDNIGQKLD